MGRIVPESCFLGFAASFAYYYGILRMRRPEWEHARFDALLAGNAPTPFQYRGLFPWIYGGIRETGIPLPLIATSKDYCFVVETLATFCLLLSFRHYMSRILPINAARQVALLPALVLPFHYLLPRFLCSYYIYDTPSVLFMTLGLILLYDRRWRLYYPLFAVATLNRETTCFLIAGYLLSALGKERYRRIGIHVLAQAAVWTAIKLSLAYAFRRNPGGIFWYRLEWNLSALTDHGHLVYVLSSLGYTWLFVLPYWRKIGNRFVRRVTLVAPVHFLAMLLVGKISEVRIYGEMMPIMLPAYLLVMKDLLENRLDRRDRATLRTPEPP